MLQVAIKEIYITRGNDEQSINDAWEIEARALEHLNKITHPHITQCIAAIRRGDSRYLVFPWADGERLRDYWRRSPRQGAGPSAELIREVIEQLRGLADGLYSLHNYGTGGQYPDGSSIGEGSAIPQIRFHENDDDIDYMDGPSIESIRHGDLKPENILRFMDQRTKLGQLKIADMGLAKRHIVATQDRKHLTSTRYGTIQYEPPEAVTGYGPRSRLHDVWSMGCITLEFVIWLLYGNDELENFYTQVRGDAGKQCQYFELPSSDEQGRPEVHRVVRTWIRTMQEGDVDCFGDTALGDLLQTVQEKLLVIALPPNRESSLVGGRTFKPPVLGKITRYRATAAEFRQSLDNILAKTHRPGYLLSGTRRMNIRLPVKNKNMLTPLEGTW
jgi:serine/threonine protein kinase